MCPLLRPTVEALPPPHAETVPQFGTIHAGPRCLKFRSEATLAIRVSGVLRLTKQFRVLWACILIWRRAPFVELSCTGTNEREYQLTRCAVGKWIYGYNQYRSLFDTPLENLRQAQCLCIRTIHAIRP